jgi:subtilase family serine protease
VRDSSEINSLIEKQTVLSKTQAVSRFAPSAKTVRAVERYLRREGFTHLTVAPDRMLVTGNATVAQADRAFHTTISRYRLNGKTIYANTSAARVPSALAGKVTAVLGLSDVPMHLTSLDVSSAKPAPLKSVNGISLPGLPTTTVNGITQTVAGVTIPNALSLPQVEQIYDATPLPSATHTSISVLAAGPMGDVIASLRQEEEANHYPAVPVTVIPDSPAAEDPDNPLTNSLEWYLDTQMSTAMAHDASELYIYTVGTFTDSEVARAINEFVSQDVAQDLSMSVGECDVLAFLDGAMIASDGELALGSLQGQSSFSSTGDNGYACPEVASTGVPEGPPGVSWPSDGYYTMAAGGTSLYGTGTHIVEETSWVGGGGGVSEWEAAPSWTMQANPFGQSWQYTNQGGRAVPDISGDSDDLVSPVLIDQGGSYEEVGGTSVSSPLNMGLWARVDSLSASGTCPKGCLGLASYDYYNQYNKTNPGTVKSTPVDSTAYLPDPHPGPVPGFVDITAGSNGGCVATPGWDDCSGIGEVRAAALAKAMHVS